MTQTTKIEGKFYPLQHQEWIKACKELTSSARDTLYFIRTADPYSNGIELTAAAIAKELGVNRSTISRALKELDSKGYIEMEIVAAKVAVTGKGLLDVAEMQQRCTGATPVAEMQHAVQPRNKRCRNATASATTQQTTAETLTTPDVQTSKTSSDLIKDLNRSLSDTRERTFLEFKESLSKEEFESFWDFAMYVAKSFKPTLTTEAIRLPEAWIRKYHQELYNQFLNGLEQRYGSRNFEEILARSKNSDNSPSVKKQEVDW